MIKPKQSLPLNSNQEMVIEEDHQEVMGSTSHSKELTTQVMKGKRTRRQRPTSPLTLGANCTLSSKESPETVLLLGYHKNTEISPSTSVELSESATDVGEEEQDMANCLILLAQGNHQTTRSINFLYNKPSSGSLIKSSSGLEVYQCKTCSRCFPSFQALGGHRASHKKPKVITHHQEDKKEIKKKPVSVNVTSKEDDHHQTRSDNNNNTITTLSLQMPTSVTKPMKVHECSICGAEFSSGQALGGHMRRHRPVPSLAKTTSMSLGTIISSPEGSQELKRPRTLELDLNLPAVPEEGLGLDSKFHFTSKKQVIVFSASPLVDCHY